MVKQCMALIDSQCSLCNAAVTHCLCAVGPFILCFFFFLMCSASGQVAWGDSVKRVILNCTGVGGSQNKIRIRRRHHSQMIIQRHTSLDPVSGLISSSLWPNPNRRSHCSSTYQQWSRTWICFGFCDCDNTADVREMYCIMKSGIR